MGIVPAPFDCAMVNRSLKTLALRMKQHNHNGLVVAKYLESHPKVEKVLHPGLPSHPQHELFKKQTSGHSGVFSFYLKGGLEESKTVLKALKVFTLAESLGGYESLAELPYVKTLISVVIKCPFVFSLNIENLQICNDSCIGPRGAKESSKNNRQFDTSLSWFGGC